MKKNILFGFLIVLLTNISLAGDIKVKGEKSAESNSKLITGKVVDVNSKEEIAGAEINISGNKIFTDLAGNFSILISTQTTEAIVKSISYKESTIKIDPFSYNTLLIEIVPQ